MGVKLLWTGLTLMFSAKVWNPLSVPVAEIIGAVLMIIGIALMWLDK